MPDPQISLLSVFFILGAAQAIFFAVILLSKDKSNKYANRYLAIFILVFAADLIGEFLDHSLYGIEYFRVMLILMPGDFLYGPLIWLYTKAISSRNYVPHRLTFLHFLPAITLAPIYWQHAFSSYSTYSDIFINNPELLSGNQIEPWIMNTYAPYETRIALLHMLAYIYLSLAILKTHSQKISNEFSYKEGVSLEWLRILLFGVSGLFALYFVRFLVADIFKIISNSDIVLNIGIVCFIYAIAYFGIRQSKIYEEDKITSRPTTKSGKYKKSALSDVDMQRIAQKITDVMDMQSLFLEADLTMPKLASIISVSPNYLSQTLNSEFNESFFDYINHKRIDYAKIQLSDKSKNHVSIIDIAMESAFNSKSAFYSAFKKHSDMTPVQFRKAQTS